LRVEFAVKMASRARRGSGQIAASCTNEEIADKRGNARDRILLSGENTIEIPIATEQFR